MTNYSNHLNTWQLSVGGKWGHGYEYVYSVIRYYDLHSETSAGQGGDVVSHSEGVTWVAASIEFCNAC